MTAFTRIVALYVVSLAICGGAHAQTNPMTGRQVFDRMLSDHRSEILALGISQDTCNLHFEKNGAEWLTFCHLVAAFIESPFYYSGRSAMSFTDSDTTTDGKLQKVIGSKRTLSLQITYNGMPSYPRCIMEDWPKGLRFVAIVMEDGKKGVASDPIGEDLIAGYCFGDIIGRAVEKWRIAHNAVIPAPPPLTDNHLTNAEIHVISERVRPCWNASFRGTDESVVEIEVEMNQNGTVKRAWISDPQKVAGNANLQALANSALRAVTNPSCQPWPLPPEKYSEWRKMKLRFDARDL